MRRKIDRETLISKPVGALLRQLALPSVAGMMVTALNNLVDAIFIGRYVGVKAIGGLAIVFPIQMIFLAFAQAFGTGGGSIISRAIGAEEPSRARAAFGNVAFLVSTISLLFLLVGTFFLYPVLNLFGASRGVAPYAADYVRIMVWGFFFYNVSMAGSNILRSVGDARGAMVARFITAAIKLSLMPLLVIMYRLGMTGAALSTGVAHFIACFFVVYRLRKQESLSLSFRDLRPRWLYIKEIFSTGASVLVRYISGSLSTLVINHTLRWYGSDYHLAVFGILYRIRVFLFNPIYGISQGLQPLLGVNYGARKFGRSAQAMRLALKWSTLVSLLLWVIALLFPTELIALFTGSSRFVMKSEGIIRMGLLGLPVAGMQVISITAFTSLGYVKSAFFLSLVRQLLIFVPLALILPLYWGTWGVWTAYPISDLISGIIGSVIIIREYNVMLLKDET